MNLLGPLLHLRAIGVVFVVLAFVHAVFPRYFDWRRELASLSGINRQLMEVHTFFIGLVVLLMGVLCIVDADALATTTLGRHVSFGLGVFWGARLVAQHLWYSPATWRGKRFETAVHVVFSLLWVWVTAVFVLVGIGAGGASAG
jgi:hypothetical protein